MDPKEALKGLVQEAVAIAVGDVTMNNAPAVDHAAVVFRAIKTKNGVSPGDAPGSTKVNGAKKAKSTKKGKGKGKGKEDNNSHVEKSRRGETNQHTARNTNIKKWAVWKPNRWKGSFAHQGNSSSLKTGQTKTKGWEPGSTNGLGGRHKSKEHGHLVGKETTTVGKMEGEPEGKALS